jgi:uncharacterized damage-inducible protein DinB
MASLLVTLYEHNTWANLRLLDFCAGLSDEQLDASAPGTFGRVRDTLVHIVRAEESYVARFASAQPEHPLQESAPFPGFKELRERAQRSGEALASLAAHAQPTQVLWGVWNGEPYAIPASTIMIQAINHAPEHRAHVATILSQHGAAPPQFDGWTYAEENDVP